VPETGPGPGDGPVPARGRRRSGPALATRRSALGARRPAPGARRPELGGRHPASGIRLQNSSPSQSLGRGQGGHLPNAAKPPSTRAQWAPRPREARPQPREARPQRERQRSPRSGWTWSFDKSRHPPSSELPDGADL